MIVIKRYSNKKLSFNPIYLYYNMSRCGNCSNITTRLNRQNCTFFIYFYADIYFSRSRLTLEKVKLI